DSVDMRSPRALIHLELLWAESVRAMMRRFHLSCGRGQSCSSNCSLRSARSACLAGIFRRWTCLSASIPVGTEEYRQPHWTADFLLTLNCNGLGSPQQPSRSRAMGSFDGARHHT